MSKDIIIKSNCKFTFIIQARVDSRLATGFLVAKYFISIGETTLFPHLQAVTLLVGIPVLSLGYSSKGEGLEPLEKN